MGRNFYFVLFQREGKNKQWPQNRGPRTCGPNLVLSIKFYWPTAKSVCLPLSMAAFPRKQQSREWLLWRETLPMAELGIFTTWSFTERLCWSLLWNMRTFQTSQLTPHKRTPSSFCVQWCRFRWEAWPTCLSGGWQCLRVGILQPLSIAFGSR